jgi:hypothetical protein
LKLEDSKLIYTFIISSLLHVILFLGFILANYVMKVEAPKPRLYVEFKDDPKAPRPGDETRRVKKQTRLRETSPNTLSAPIQPQAQSLPTKNATAHEPSIGKKLRELSPSNDNVFLRSGSAPSTFRQQFQSFLPPDIEIGDIQALNTDYNVFFSFYNRMAEKVVYPWALNVVSGFDKMKATGQLGNQRKAWATIVEVILDKDGNLVSTQPLQLAGDWEIDNAPLRAFKQAKTFPNPPAEMVEDDGYIHIRYKFLVYYNPM